MFRIGKCIETESSSYLGLMGGRLEQRTDVHEVSFGGHENVQN